MRIHSALSNALAHSSLYHLACDSEFVINVCVGKETNCLPFKLSTSFEETFVLDGDVYAKGYKYKESPTFKNMLSGLGRKYNDEYITGRYAKDDFYIQHTDIVVKGLQFIIVEKGIDLSNTNYIGVIGIGNEYAYSYKDSGFFQKLFLTITNGKRRNLSLMRNGLLIGTDVSAITRLSTGKVMKRCSIVNDRSDSKNVIACQIDSSFIYNEKYKYVEYKSGKEKIKFSYDSDDMYVPRHVYENIKNLLFPFEGRDECRESVTRGGQHKIKCDFDRDDYTVKNEIYYNLSQRKLFLFINNFTVSFALDELFDWKATYFRALYHENDDNWVLGRHFLDKHMLTIDKSDNCIYITTNSNLNNI